MASRPLIQAIVLFLLLSLAVGVDTQLSTKNYKPTIRKSYYDSNFGANSGSASESSASSSTTSESSSSSSVSPCQYPGYSMTNVIPTNNGFLATLNLISPGPYGQDSPELTLQIILQSEQIVRFTIFDSKVNRWEVIPGVIKAPVPSGRPSVVDYNIEFTQEPFGFSINRVSNGEVIFNTTIPLGCTFNGLIFSENYLELSTSFSTPNPNLYGLGERTSPLRLSNNITYTIFNKDQGTASTPNINLYGSHPFYMQLSPNGQAHGVFLFNSNAMDVVIQPNSLTYKVVGGILDLYFFLGPTPNEVIQQYTSIIGTTHMPTYWSLGWHQCRWGYHTVEDTLNVVTNYSLYNIPLETMWNDIDYMDKYKDFTLDPDNFPQPLMAELISLLHGNNQHYIMIVDPGIYNQDDQYQTYQDLMASGAYIRQSDGQTPLVGKVWPGYTLFPDFLHPNAQSFWTQQFRGWYKQVEFDGVWIDMNEPSNFCDGDCGSSSDYMPPGEFNPNIPPYLPGGVPLDDNTLNMTSLQYNNTLFYDSHNLFGYTEGIATRIAIEGILGTRSTIISRSSYAGSGYHYGHWLGDNTSTFTDLYYSIPGILAMNMFGIPMVGADICGFNGNTTIELCSRWLQLGNFYPFSRNHNSYNSMSQEPYSFNSTQVVDIAISSINLKYTLAPFYYTLFSISHTSGDPVVRPLFFEYPTDPNTYALDTQFLVGTSLMVSPVLTDGARSVNAYFPNDVWYDYFTGQLVLPVGKFQNLSAPIDYINVHLRGGNIIPTQPTSQYVRPSDGIPVTLSNAKQLPFNLIVALDTNGTANGQVYLDDGLTYQFENGEYTNVFFSVLSDQSQYKFISIVEASGYDVSTIYVDTITVYGVENSPSNVNVNGQPTNQYTFSNLYNSLIIQLNVTIYENFEVDWVLN
ncbi:alpha-glucosidase [Tieghemostelium lacteum]|uniref:Maltase n=1 Tax=Tieghemostelium lacteum TaxID=361077 RepID=A0A151Z5C3_TIELA|nr:alpha-glucosidase [Tieghemostelium lacteum]|eukprot:KYQ89141.1 alpha-glucosidase [Tieghemostelium lacteum]